MVTVETRGNVLTAISFLTGLAQADVPALEEQIDDPHYPVNIQARAVKPDRPRQTSKTHAPRPSDVD